MTDRASTADAPKVSIQGNIHARPTVDNEDALQYVHDYIIDNNITNPKEIHKYFQDAKRELLEKICHVSPERAGWAIPESQGKTINIAFHDAVNILPHLYATLHPKLKNEFDDNAFLR